MTRRRRARSLRPPPPRHLHPRHLHPHHLHPRHLHPRHLHPRHLHPRHLHRHRDLHPYTLPPHARPRPRPAGHGSAPPQPIAPLRIRSASPSAWTATSTRWRWSRRRGRREPSSRRWRGSRDWAGPASNSSFTVGSFDTFTFTYLLCRCFAAPACRVFLDHVSTPGESRRVRFSPRGLAQPTTHNGQRGRRAAAAAHVVRPTTARRPR